MVVEAGGKISKDWSAYGDAWVQPTQGFFGADVGARFQNSIDLFAGAQADVRGDWQATAGVKYHF